MDTLPPVFNSNTPLFTILEGVVTAADKARESPALIVNEFTVNGAEMALSFAPVRLILLLVVVKEDIVPV